MAQLDQFIKAMLSRPGSEIRLGADTEPLLVMGARQHPLVAKKLTATHVRQLLGEILPDNVKRQLEESNLASFSYTAPGLEPVQVEIRGWSTLVAATFRAGAAAPRAAETPRAPEPAPASSPGLASLDELELDTSGPPRDAARSPHAAAAAARAPAPITATSTAAVSTFSAGGGSIPDMQEIFRVMFKMGSSDLHLSSDEKPMIRKDGDMERLEQYPVLDSQTIQKLVFPLMPERARNQFEETKDADFAYEIVGLSRFRGNVFADRKGVGAVFRTIPTEIISAEKLGLSQAIQNLGFLSKGLVLVTGPTGSGKSTTLCAIIDLINRKRSDHIITIEDPIEFVHPNKSCLVNQREVGEHTESFKRALKAALREDPDIVLVGEMRDLETIAIAIETAETGHLVFGTLHTSTAPSTVDRIIDQFPADRQSQIRVMLSESLKGVISQTLCKKIGGGRVAALEVLLVNAAVSNLIREGKTFQIPSIMQTQRKAGMVMLNDALLELVLQKKVEPKEAYVKAIDKQQFQILARQAGVNLDFLETAAPAPGAPPPAAR